jgi:hypothetical protein
MSQNPPRQEMQSTYRQRSSLLVTRATLHGTAVLFSEPLHSVDGCAKIQLLHGTVEDSLHVSRVPPI